MNHKLRHLVPGHAWSVVTRIRQLSNRYKLTSDTGGTVLLFGGGGGLLLGLGGGGRQRGHFGGEALEVGLKLVLWNGTN